MPKANDPSRKRCAATTATGKPCWRLEANGTPYCPNHDPALKAKRSENASKGGKCGPRKATEGAQAGNGPRPITMQSVMQCLNRHRRQIRDEIRSFSEAIEKKLADPE